MSNHKGLGLLSILDRILEVTLLHYCIQWYIMYFTKMVLRKIIKKIIYNEKSTKKKNSVICTNS